MNSGITVFGQAVVLYVVWYVLLVSDEACVWPDVNRGCPEHHATRRAGEEDEG